MKRVSLVVALLAVVALSTSAFGFSFTYPYQGPVKIKYSNFEEVVIPGVQEELSGIAVVTSIEPLTQGQQQLWSPSASGEELTVVFEGYVLETVDPVTGDYYFSGGTYTVYYDTSPDFDATYPGSGVTDGTVFLTMSGTPGIIPADIPSTPFDESQTTLYSDLSVTTIPQTGHGVGYLTVTGGDYAWLFGGTGALLLVESDFSPPQNNPNQLYPPYRPGFGWPIVSEDPITGNVVPEPGTFVLVGAGLVGLGFLARRRREDR